MGGYYAVFCARFRSLAKLSVLALLVACLTVSFSSVLTSQLTPERFFGIILFGL